jgi:hypothetical protein
VALLAAERMPHTEVPNRLDSVRCY